jgi:hypothetical protein
VHRRIGEPLGLLERRSHRPVRYVANNFYTRDDDTLVHDFFHVVTDNRNNGDPCTCNQTPQTQTESVAYGTTPAQLHPSHHPLGSDFAVVAVRDLGTFGSTYYWASGSSVDEAVAGGPGVLPPAPSTIRAP